MYDVYEEAVCTMILKKNTMKHINTIFYDLSKFDKNLLNTTYQMEKKRSDSCRLIIVGHPTI